MLKRLLSKIPNPWKQAREAEARVADVNSALKEARQTCADIQETLEAEINRLRCISLADTCEIRAINAERRKDAATIARLERKYQDTQLWLADHFYQVGDICAAGTADEEGVPLAEKCEVIKFPGRLQ